MPAKSASRPPTPPDCGRPPKGWFSRLYLPHFDFPGLVQSLTFRLADSLPKDALERVEAEIAGVSAERRDLERVRRLDEWFDAGAGGCFLAEPAIAELVEGALLHFDGERYRMLAWCVMPNHVHALVKTRPGFPLPEIVHSWKSFTANRANRLLKHTGPFWMREYHDRYIRNGEHFERARCYIEGNPVSAGLVSEKSEWRWGSAWKWRGER